MKKFLSLLLIGSLLIFPSGCGTSRTDSDQTVSFYYLRSSDSYIYGATDGVVSYENRDTAGHNADLNYLLMLYLQGPLAEDLISPFPQGCKLLQLDRNDGKLTVLLNSNMATLRGMDLTLACVCFAKTCFSLTDADSIRIMVKTFDGKISIDQTITIDSLLLEDTLVPDQSDK